MGIFKDVEQRVEEWVFGVALKKAIKAAGTFLVAFITSVKVQPILTQWGVTIDPNQVTMALTGLLTGLLTMLLNYIKTKTHLNV
jgi:hypothetical protein